MKGRNVGPCGGGIRRPTTVMPVAMIGSMSHRIIVAAMADVQNSGAGKL